MADPNAKRDSALTDIARLLKDQNRILETVNNNLVAVSEIFAPNKESKPPYTQRHLPYLDQLHDDMGMSEWWLRSEQRQNILNTQDE